jgi:hypothetical protein
MSLGVAGVSDLLPLFLACPSLSPPRSQANRKNASRTGARCPGRIGRTAARTRSSAPLHHNFSNLLSVQVCVSGSRRPGAPLRWADWRGWFKEGKGFFLSMQGHAHF